MPLGWRVHIVICDRCRWLGGKVCPIAAVCGLCFKRRAVNLHAFRELVHLGQLADCIHCHLDFTFHVAVYFSPEHSFPKSVKHSLITALFRKLSKCWFAATLNNATEKSTLSLVVVESKCSSACVCLRNSSEDKVMSVYLWCSMSNTEKPNVVIDRWDCM